MPQINLFFIAPTKLVQSPNMDEILFGDQNEANIWSFDLLEMWSAPCVTLCQSWLSEIDVFIVNNERDSFYFLFFFVECKKKKKSI